MSPSGMDVDLLRGNPGMNPMEKQAGRIEVIQVPWWGYVAFSLAVVTAVWGFGSLVNLETRILTHRTDRTAEDLYDKYADSARKERRYAKRHGGQWHEEENRSQRS
jgi:hypothetical protein